MSTQPANDTPPRPTPPEISELLRTMPQQGEPACERDAWIARKLALLAAIEAST